MKKIVVLAGALVLFFCCYVSAQCALPANEVKGMAGMEQQMNAVVVNAMDSVATGGPEKVIVGNKICPVTGEEIAPGAQAQFEYKGKVYNFCCPMCIETFKQDPEKYIKNLAEKEKAAAEKEAADNQKKSAPASN